MANLVSKWECEICGACWSTEGNANDCAANCRKRKEKSEREMRACVILDFAGKSEENMAALEAVMAKRR